MEDFPVAIFAALISVFLAVSVVLNAKKKKDQDDE